MEDDHNAETIGKPSGGVILLGAMFLIVLYILSPIPVIFVLDRAGLDGTSWVDPVLETIYAPIIILHDGYPAVQAFYEWQEKLLGV